MNDKEFEEYNTPEHPICGAMGEWTLYLNEDWQFVKNESLQCPACKSNDVEWYIDVNNPNLVFMTISKEPDIHRKYDFCECILCGFTWNQRRNGEHV